MNGELENRLLAAIRREHETAQAVDDAEAAKMAAIKAEDDARDAHYEARTARRQIESEFTGHLAVTS